MPARVSRVALQVVSLATIAARAPNPLLEMIGLTEARADGDHLPRARAILQIHAPGALVDEGVRRETQLRLGAQRVLTAALTGSQNDWHPAGIEDAEIILTTSASDATITGLSVFESRVPIRLWRHAGPGTLTLSAESTSSQRDNRFAGEITLAAGGLVWLIRDPISSRWRSSAGTVAAAPDEGGSLLTENDGPDVGQLNTSQGFF
jgi:hypothetical protein